MIPEVKIVRCFSPLISQVLLPRCLFNVIPEITVPFGGPRTITRSKENCGVGGGLQKVFGGEQILDGFIQPFDFIKISEYLHVQFITVSMKNR